MTNCFSYQGLETLEKSISFWEESLHMIDENIENGDDRELSTKHQLVRILDLAYELQKATEELYLNEVLKHWLY